MILENFINVKTFKTKDLPKKYRLQIQDIINQIISDKKDEYWENYENFYLFEQVAVTVGLIDDNVKAFASIFNNDFYEQDVYRILNRLFFTEDIRESGSTKTYKGSHRTFPIIQQQIEFVNTLNPKFYFISRQRKNTRYFKYFFNKYNNTYNANLTVSDKQYWVCSNKKDKYGCCQTIVYPKDKQIPFMEDIRPVTFLNLNHLIDIDALRIDMNNQTFEPFKACNAPKTSFFYNAPTWETVRMENILLDEIPAVAKVASANKWLKNSRFYKQHANTSVPAHTDISDGPLASVNILISDNNSPVHFVGWGDYTYYCALLDVTQVHKVDSCPEERHVLKFSIFDKTYEQMKEELKDYISPQQEFIQ